MNRDYFLKVVFSRMCRNAHEVLIEYKNIDGEDVIVTGWTVEKHIGETKYEFIPYGVFGTLAEIKRLAKEKADEEYGYILEV